MAETNARRNIDRGFIAPDEIETLKRPTVTAHSAGHRTVRHTSVWTWNSRSRSTIPLGLLFLFLAISFVTVLVQSHNYGITIDEPLQQQYGEHVYAWYRTLGKDTSFLTAFPVDDHMPEHGGVFDAGVVAVQHLFKNVDPWLVRRVVTGLAGWLGIVGIALCGYELGGGWMALASAIGLWLYPRYYGAMYNNPKDIPAAVTFTFVIWATLLLVKRWQRRETAIGMSVLLGVSLGTATAIRVTALSWFGVLLALLAGWWVINARSVWRERRIVAELVQQGVVAETIGVSALLSTMILWPFVFINPFTNLLESIQVLSHYPWNGLELYNGVDYLATKLPRSYLLTWIVIGSPPLLLLLAVIGVAIIAVEAGWKRRLSASEATAFLALAVPLAPLLLLHPVLYDTLRQVLFLIPPLVLLAAYSLVRIVTTLLHQRKAQWRYAGAAVIAVTVVSYVLVVAEMVALSPYEYAYFSPVIGGIQGAAGKFNTDYYGTCTKAAATWLGQNYEQYTTSSSPTLDASFLLVPSLTPYLPANFHISSSHPNFFVGFTRDHNEALYPQYKVIHVVAAESVPLCVIKANPATDPSP